MSTPIDIEGSNALRAMQLVAGEGEKLDAEVVDVEGKFAYGLHRVHVQGNLPVIGDTSDFANREKNAAPLFAHNKVTSAVSGRIARSSFSG